jgi:two-component system response regulator YesN
MITMYKLFIVDDEYDVIEGIKTSMDWSEYNIEICGGASNGAEAFDRIFDIRPDIMIVDMNMPVVGGIELIEKVRTAGIDAEFVILSGYDDFNYAQRAMNLGVAEYLLKPCHIEEILKAVLNVRELLEEKRTQKKLLDQYKAQFRNNAATLKELLLTRLLDGKTLVEEDVIQEEIHLYGIFLLDTNFTVVLYKIDQYPAIMHALPVVREEFGKAGLPNEALIYKGDIVSICSASCSREMFEGIFHRILKRVRAEFSLHMTIVAGYEIAELDALPSCYRKCRDILNTEAFLGIDEIIFCGDNMEGKKTKINKLIEAGIDYIKNHYAEDIKLETVAKKIFITSGYLSILFKQTTGINFLDYLHRYRIQISKDLLKDVRRKIYEIADMVGYQDEKYFSRTFKKFTGLSPKQYRESLKGSSDEQVF